MQFSLTTLALPVLLLLSSTAAMITFSTQPGHTACDYKSNKDPILQRAAFDCFINDFYIENNYTKALRTYVAADYIQHNPYLPNGREPLVQLFAAQPLPPGGILPIRNLHQTLQNNTGLLHYVRFSSNASDPPVVNADVWRFEGPCIVEHWDVIQAVPANSSNPHPMY